MKRMLQRYFSFDGRLARLRFFGRSIFVGVGAAAVSIASVPFFSTDTRLGYWAGVLVLIMALALLAVGLASLTIRRLHDLGLSGYHAIWVGAAQVGWAVLSRAPPEKLVFGLPLAAVCLWITFWPGNRKANRFGDVPE
jgi:uncharacterized membrane protein YhaH (DUF805 family)